MRQALKVADNPKHQKIVQTSIWGKSAICLHWNINSSITGTGHFTISRHMDGQTIYQISFEKCRLADRGLDALHESPKSRTQSILACLLYGDRCKKSEKLMTMSTEFIHRDHSGGDLISIRVIASDKVHSIKTRIHKRWEQYRYLM